MAWAIPQKSKSLPRGQTSPWLTILHPWVTLDGQARQQQRAPLLPLARWGTRRHGGDSNLFTTSLARSEGAAWPSCYLDHPILNSKYPKKTYWPKRQAMLRPFCPPDQHGKDREGKLTVVLWSPRVQQGSWPSSLLKVLGRLEVSYFGPSSFTTTLLFTFLNFACYILFLVGSTHNISMPAGDKISCFA